VAERAEGGGVNVFARLGLLALLGQQHGVDVGEDASAMVTVPSSGQLLVVAVASGADVAGMRFFLLSRAALPSQLEHLGDAVRTP
jgi:hypothetical protein